MTEQPKIDYILLGIGLGIVFGTFIGMVLEKNLVEINKGKIPSCAEPITEQDKGINGIFKRCITEIPVDCNQPENCKNIIYQETKWGD